MRHNEIRNLTSTTLLTEVCHLVQVEPELQPFNSPETFSLLTVKTQDGARLDIAMNGIWDGHTECCYADVRVVNPYALSYVSSLSAAYKWHEDVKRSAYRQRAQEVEYASFNPLY